MSELFFEDLAVGRRFGSGRRTIEAVRIKAFAAEFDPQPFHLDGEAAKGSLFGGLAASGWHTAALTMRLLVESSIRRTRWCSRSSLTFWCRRAQRRGAQAFEPTAKIGE
jgi:acyl dehydratase